jgi:branched-chain amino acid transport system ATP-binding protein
MSGTDGAANGAPLLVSDLSRRFGGLPALEGVGFEASQGRVTALIGPNGAGKTTLLNCLTGVLVPDRGSVVWERGDITGLPPHSVARLGIARTFQNLRLFGDLSVLDNALVGLTVEAGGSFVEAVLRLPSLRRRERNLRLRALEALDEFGLGGKADWPAAALSYGDKKRLEMARAFVGRPRLVLLDEPVAGLNAEETERVAALIRRKRAGGATVLLVEHDMELVMGVSDRVVVLDGGRKIAEGTPSEVTRNPLVLEAYLGTMSLTA